MVEIGLWRPSRGNANGGSWPLDCGIDDRAAIGSESCMSVNEREEGTAAVSGFITPLYGNGQ